MKDPFPSQTRHCCLRPSSHFICPFLSQTEFGQGTLPSPSFKSGRFVLRIFSMLRQNPHGAEPLPAHWMQVIAAFPLPSQVGQATDSLSAQAEHLGPVTPVGLDAGSCAKAAPVKQATNIHASIVLMG